MTVAAGTPSRPRRWPVYARWSIGFAVALIGHAGAALALLANWHVDAEQVASAPAITIDMAPLPSAPAPKPTEVAPGHSETQASSPPEPIQSKPIEKIVLPPDPAPQAEVRLPPQKPVEKMPEPAKAKPVPRPHASLDSAPSHAERHAARPAAPAPGADARNPQAVPSWKSRLMAQLERNKRYPLEAQSRREQGVVQLAFSVDRNGGVHHARISRSSGSRLLDRATLELLVRAAPLPPPPPEIRGAQIAIAVPIRYSLR
jgi:protein TonB